MTVDRIVHSVAGTFILLSLALAKFHNPNWIWFTVFVGANLLQSGLTNWCLMSWMLGTLGSPHRGGETTRGIRRAHDRGDLRRRAATQISCRLCANCLARTWA